MKRISVFSLIVIVAVPFIVSHISALADVYIWLDSDGIKQFSNIRPEWWTEEMDIMAPGTVVDPGLDRKFIGDTGNRKFHWPLCNQIYVNNNPKGQMAIPELQRIWFRSFQEAIDQGYHVCDFCVPSEDGPEFQPQLP
jgi:hypothetical protein